MYALISEGSIQYLGDDADVAMELLGRKSDAHLDARLEIVVTLEELKRTFESHSELKFSKKKCEKESPLEEVLKRLEEVDITEEAEEVLRKTKETGEQAIGEVRSLGLRGLQGLGQSVVALGDLLLKAGKENQESGQEKENEL